MFARLLGVAIVGLGLWTMVTQAPRSGAATAQITQTCSASVPGAATVQWAWPKPAPGAQQTWLDLSLVPGFAPGWFKGHGAFSGTQTVYALDGVPQGLTFFYRVNTLFPSGWRETASGSFVSSCSGGGGSGPPVAGNVTQVCDGSGGVAVTFSWQAKASGPQWLDLSVFNNGFVPGSFVGVGPIGSGGGSFTWYGIMKGTTHFWRVNTLSPSGWMTSNTAAFTSLSCIPPLKACIGFLSGLSGAGRAECDQLMAGADRTLADCIAYILKLPSAGGKAACANVRESGTVVDCLLGLSGQSYFGATSCRLYYQG